MLPNFKVIIGAAMLCGLLFAIAGLGIIMPENHTRVGEMPTVGRPTMQRMITDEPAQSHFRIADLERRAEELDRLRDRAVKEISTVSASHDGVQTASEPLRDPRMADASTNDTAGMLSVSESGGARSAATTVSEPRAASAARLPPVVRGSERSLSAAAILVAPTARPAFVRPTVITQPKPGDDPGPVRTATPMARVAVGRDGGAIEEQAGVRSDGALDTVRSVDAEDVPPAPGRNDSAVAATPAIPETALIAAGGGEVGRLSPKLAGHFFVPRRGMHRLRFHARGQSEPKYDQFDNFSQFNQFRINQNTFNQNNYRFSGN